MGKIFVSGSNIFDSHIEIDEPNDVHHLSRVLRVKVGDSLEISDGVKWEYDTEITEITKDKVVCRILDCQAHAREPKTKVTLYQGFPKAGKLDTIIQKCVELGINKIVPVFMDRSIVSDNGKAEKKMDRWQKIADEASTQCRRGIRPEISAPIKLTKATDMIKSHDFILLPYENEEGRTIKTALSEYRQRLEDQGSFSSTDTTGSDSPDIAVIIGPEGGFSDKEVAMLKELGADCVSLGKTILRTETAGMAALSMIMYEMEL